MENLAKHLLRELHLHARNDLSPKVNERWDGMIAMPLKLRQVLDPVRNPYSGSSGSEQKSRRQSGGP
eukprot:592824-Heterocapsa_arctica.AAC.1